MQQPIAEPLCERGAAGEEDVAEELLAQVHVGAVDGVEDYAGDAWVFEAD